VADYTCADPAHLTPLTCAGQASVNTAFEHQKHYFLLMQNIERACFTALDASINNAFKVSNNLTIIGWHAGMTVCKILDQLSNIYGQLTPAATELNDVAFHNQYFCSQCPRSPLPLH
jgi:hypothetical protein